MYGGEISNNIQEMLINKNMISGILPEKIESDRKYDAKGAIYLSNSTFNMYGGKICNNQCINNCELFTNENSTNNENSTSYDIYQRSVGAAIYANHTVKIHLYKGEISNNFAINNAIINLITPKEENKKTNLRDIVQSIYGSAIYAYYSRIEIYDGFLIQNNYSKNNSVVNFNNNCFNKNIIHSIEGGQVYLNYSKIKINGGIVKNSNNVQNTTTNISPDLKGNTKSESITINGGGINIQNSKNFEINTTIFNIIFYQ
jgi:hypothetical protein